MNLDRLWQAAVLRLLGRLVSYAALASGLPDSTEKWMREAEAIDELVEDLEKDARQC